MTDTDGKATICVPTAATRWVEYDIGGGLGFAPYGASWFTGTINRTLTTTAASGRCCVRPALTMCAPPYTTMAQLWYTDATGTYPGGPPPVTCYGATWTVLRTLPAQVWSAEIVGGSCVRSLGPGTIEVYHEAAPAPGGGMRVYRWWTEGTFDGVTGYVPASGIAGPSGLCATGVLRNARSVATIPPMDCRDYYGSAAFAPDLGVLPDPIGGSVVVSD